MTTPPAPITGVLETVLYATDLKAAGRFYADALGLEHISGDGTLSLAYRIAPGAVLLIFDPAMSGRAGRDLPSHGATGPGHIAFRISPDSCDAWLARLRDAGVDIEHEEHWDQADPADPRSIYVRDPAGNSVELITSDIW